MYSPMPPLQSALVFFKLSLILKYVIKTLHHHGTYYYSKKLTTIQLRSDKRGTKIIFEKYFKLGIPISNLEYVIENSILKLIINI